MDGGWTDWRELGECSKECGEGGGVQVRERSCTNPPPLHDGRDCEGKDLDVIRCNEDCDSPDQGRDSLYQYQSHPEDVQP